VLKWDNSSGRPALRRSSSAGNLHAQAQPSAPCLSPRSKELTASDRIAFISSGLVPTRTASEHGAHHNWNDESPASPITSPPKFSRTASAGASPTSPELRRTTSAEPRKFARTASAGASPTSPELRRTSSTEPPDTRIRFLEKVQEKNAVTLNQRTPKPAQETKSSKLRGSLVQSSFLQKKLAVFDRGGIQVKQETFNHFFCP